MGVGGHLPRREVAEEIECADTLILNVQPPGLWENKCLLLKQPRLPHFVRAALADMATQWDTLEP